MTDIPPTLAEGYRRFRTDRFAQESARYRTLALGQRPRTMIIGCADSRVDPATIFSAAPGELFVVRNVAALVPPFEETGTYHGTSAAIEFAVVDLQIENIVVMGHGLCGGIAAALAAAGDRPVGRFIGPWVGLISGVRDALIEETAGADPEHLRRRLEQLAVQHSLANITGFPFVKRAVEEGCLSLHGAWFSIAEGSLRWLDAASGDFQPVDP